MKRTFILCVFISYLLGLYAQSVSSKDFISYFVKNYSEAQLADLYKSFYQDNFGPGHLLADTVQSRKYFEYELADTTEWSGPEFEYTGEGKNYVRINMDLIRKGVIPADAYFNAFVNSVADKPQTDPESWIKYWNAIDTILIAENIHFPNEETDRAMIDEKLRTGKFTVHHSDNFNDAYNFHYRIISLPEFEKLRAKYNFAK